MSVEINRTAQFTHASSFTKSAHYLVCLQYSPLKDARVYVTIERVFHALSAFHSKSPRWPFRLGAVIPRLERSQASTFYNQNHGRTDIAGAYPILFPGLQVIWSLSKLSSGSRIQRRRSAYPGCSCATILC
jgi:hypothetical protein